MARDALLKALVDRQGNADQVVFAARLGISQGYWSHLRRGTRPLSDRLVRRIRAVFPDLEALCIAALIERQAESGRRAVA